MFPCQRKLLQSKIMSACLLLMIFRLVVWGAGAGRPVRPWLQATISEAVTRLSFVGMVTYQPAAINSENLEITEKDLWISVRLPIDSN